VPPVSAAQYIDRVEVDEKGRLMNQSSPVGMMLQFAFGPGSAGAKSPSSLTANADGDMACETSLQILALAAAARTWWESGRPKGWSLEQHLADPTIGHDGSEAERALAEAIGQWVQQGS
jgi:hypothetical protein